MRVGLIWLIGFLFLPLVAGCQNTKLGIVSNENGQKSLVEQAPAGQSPPPTGIHADQQDQLPQKTKVAAIKKEATIRNEETSQSEIRKRQSLAESILFQPLKYPKGFGQFEIKGQRVQFASEDGTKLDGRLFRGVHPRGMIVFCHGNGGNLVSRTERMDQLAKRTGYSIFLFDYRGYGRSEGKPTVSGVVADGRAAVRKAAELAGVQPSQVIVMGRSLGGAVAVQLATTFDSRALIVESSFTSFRDVARHHAGWLANLTRKTDLTSEQDIRKFGNPVFISHGTKDRVVPFEQGQRLYAAAGEPKTFFRIDGGGHNDPLPKACMDALVSFIRSLD